MAELAQTYHQNLQTDAEPPSTNEVRKQQIRTPLEVIPPTQILMNPGESEMDRLLDMKNVAKALTLMKNRTATGVDGSI